MKHSTGINRTFDAESHNIVCIVLGDPVCLCHRLEKVELINRLAIKKNGEKSLRMKKKNSFSNGKRSSAKSIVNMCHFGIVPMLHIVWQTSICHCDRRVSISIQINKRIIFYWIDCDNKKKEERKSERPYEPPLNNNKINNKVLTLMVCFDRKCNEASMIGWLTWVNNSVNRRQTAMETKMQRFWCHWIPAFRMNM